MKNQLPQVEFERITVCSLDRVLYQPSYVQEQLSWPDDPHNGYKARQSKECRKSKHTRNKEQDLDHTPDHMTSCDVHILLRIIPQGHCTSYYIPRI